MKYQPDDCLRDLIKVWNSKQSDDDEASLVFFLLEIMRDKGSKGVADLIRSFDQSELGNIEFTESENEVLIKITRDGLNPLIVAAGDDEVAPWVDVRIESNTAPTKLEDPRHTAFYSTWERLQQLDIDSTTPRAAQERAVYLIALLEAELMNGGIGQYLCNTEGCHLPETFTYLEQIGAIKTYALLKQAVNLANGFDSYVHAWDEKSDSYSRLDSEFLASNEDLAALTADSFLH